MLIDKVLHTLEKNVRKTNTFGIMSVLNTIFLCFEYETSLLDNCQKYVAGSQALVSNPETSIQQRACVYWPQLWKRQCSKQQSGTAEQLTCFLNDFTFSCLELLC